MFRSDSNVTRTFSMKKKERIGERDKKQTQWACESERGPKREREGQREREREWEWDRDRDREIERERERETETERKREWERERETETEREREREREGKTMRVLGSETKCNGGWWEEKKNEWEYTLYSDFEVYHIGRDCIMTMVCVSFRYLAGWHNWITNSLNIMYFKSKNMRNRVMKVSTETDISHLTSRVARMLWHIFRSFQWVIYWQQRQWH